MVSADELKRALKQRGLRMTPQRQLILDAVAAMHGHVSADQVYQQVVRVFPDVNISTVYRTLEVLEELGVVRHTHFHAGVAQYERTDEAPHHHMLCSRCGSDFELDLDVLQPLADELKRRYGFQADLAHSAIVGLCRACAAAG
jgi:Fur family transcriptional regulator, ferric uptake regulator